MMLGLNIHKLIINVWYQFINKSVWTMLTLYLLMALVLLVILWAMVQESPRWLYINFFFSKSRKNLIPIAKFNRVPRQ